MEHSVFQIELVTLQTAYAYKRAEVQGEIYSESPKINGKQIPNGNPNAKIYT